MTASPIFAAFLRDICTQPSDDTPRLILADWMEENATAQSDLDRATFIRSQVAYATLPARCDKEGDPLEEELTSPRFYRKRCRCRPCRLRRAAYYSGRRWIVWEWTRELQAIYEPELEEAIHAPPEAGFTLHAVMEATSIGAEKWSRGFVSHVTLSEQAFLQHAAALVKAAPITAVTLSDKRPSRISETSHPEIVGWYKRWSAGTRSEDELSPELFGLLPASEGGNSWATTGGAEAAQAALSDACITLARSLANLPLLESPAKEARNAR
jgi:uncharacterized protein (TIGR02996 family)